MSERSILNAVFRPISPLLAYVEPFPARLLVTIIYQVILMAAWFMLTWVFSQLTPIPGEFFIGPVGAVMLWGLIFWDRTFPEE